MREHFRSFSPHQIDEIATHPIARFSGCRMSLLLLAWNSHAASSRLTQQPENEVSVKANVSETNVKRSGRSQKRTLGRVQLRSLG